MKTIDLAYIALNSFMMLKRKYFFQPQQLLEGKSICDICLNDPKAIEYGLKLFNKNAWPQDKLSELNDLCGDQGQHRRKILSEMNIYPKFLLLNRDMNMVSTIRRGMEQHNKKSLKLILNTIFD